MKLFAQSLQVNNFWEGRDVRKIPKDHLSKLEVNTQFLMLVLFCGAPSGQQRRSKPAAEFAAKNS
jgi:hypothetical protein